MGAGSPQYVAGPVATISKTLGGGLNTSSGPLGVADNESPDLQNIEFDKFGSILKRNGYQPLNTTPTYGATGTPQGLYWYTNPISRQMVKVDNGHIFAMDSLSGSFRDVTGGISMVAGGVDANTVALLHFDGINTSASFTEQTGKTVTVPMSFDSYTKFLSHFDGTQGVVSFLDTATGKTITNTANYDSYTKLMLHLSATPFVDACSSPKAITNSNTSLDTTNTWNTYATAYFAGTNAELTTPNSADFQLGSGDFTLEADVRIDPSQTAGTIGCITSQFVGGAGSNEGWMFGIDTTEVSFFYTTNGSTEKYVYFAYAFTKGIFYNIVVQRNTTGLRAFVNGVPVGSVYNIALDSIYASTRVQRVGSDSGGYGYWFKGNMAEVRVSKGIARYPTAGFTPPTAPFGQVYVDTSVKKFGTGSARFLGGGENLSLAASADFNFGTGDWTIDAWAYWVNNGVASQGIMGLGDDNSTTGAWGFYFNSSGVISYEWNDGSDHNKTGGSITAGSWNHLAVIKYGNNLYIAVNGVLSAPTDVTGKSFGEGTDALVFGYATYAGVKYYSMCNIDELRISKGIARWTANFTPPTYSYGQVYADTSTKEFGISSGCFLGGGEYISMADSADWSFGSGAFTIDSWYSFENTNTQVLFFQTDGGTNYVGMQYTTATNVLNFYVYQSGYTLSFTCPFTPTIGTWYHLAVIRGWSGGANTWAITINGVHQTLTLTAGSYSIALPDVGGAFCIGGYSGSTANLTGNIDEFRVSKGIARWTSDFTPSTSPYGYYQLQDFETFLTYLLGSDESNVPWKYDGTNTCSSMTVLTGLTGCKLIKQFQNYCVMANVRISGVKYGSRIMWSAIKTIDTWDAADYIDISKDDGDEITGLRVLGDRLCVYKNNSIYVVSFTGDADVPFVVQKTNSAVGCAAPFSIQEWGNGHVFLSYDGVYFFDGNSSEKMTDRINDTVLSFNNTQLINAVSMYQKNKCRYWLGVATATYNNFVLTWNSFLNSWSKYAGMSTSAMTIVRVGGTEERPYFSDYSGTAFRADYGVDDCPSNVVTAVAPYYETNWKSYDDICDKKGVPHIYIVNRTETTTTNLAVSWYYDFNTSSHNTRTVSLLSQNGLVSTGYTQRIDLSGRGRFVKIRLSEAGTGTAFRVDGLGAMVTLESMA